MDLQLGALLGGRYRIERKLGQGGMGSVYEASDLSLKRTVAIKLLHEAAQEEALSRFSLEARAVAALAHPHIAALFDFDPSRNPVPFLVMERIEGESLRGLLGRERALHPARAVHIARQMLAALAAAHTAGTVHRDIKPSNVMLVRSAAVPDLVKLVDFGVAKMAEGTTRQHHTAQGAVVGTLQYMSPEQASGLPAAPSTDLYAVGVCLFEMIAGYNPFAVGDLPAVLVAIRNLVPPLLSQVRADVPLALAQVVARALAKAPDQRFPRAEDFALALGAAMDPNTATHVQGPPTSLGPPMSMQPAPTTLHGAHAAPTFVHHAPPAARSGGGFVAGMLVAVLLLGLGGGITWYFVQSSATPPPSATAVASSSTVATATPPVIPTSSSTPTPPASTGPTPRAPKADTNAPAGNRCLCLPIWGQPGLEERSAALCRAKQAPLCKCEHNSGTLCLAPWSKPPNSNELTCSLPNTHQSGHAPNEACKGYNQATKNFQPINEPVTGAYECKFCTQTRSWAGKSNDSCTGFAMRDGKPFKGVLDCD